MADYQVVEPPPKVTPADGETVERKPQPRKSPVKSRLFTKAQENPSVKASKPMPKAGEISKGVAELYALAGVLIMPKNPVIGQSILENAEACGKSLEELAKTNESVRRVLIGLTTTSVWGAVAMAHAPILMAVFAEVTKDKPVELTEDTDSE